MGYSVNLRVLFIVSGLISLMTLGCKKGEMIHSQEYIKLSIDAFYADTVLFSSVSINDSVVAQNPSMIPATYTSLINKEFSAPVGDSARMRFLIVKKHGSNISFDSVLHFTNNNDFLFLQLDPSAKPSIINKRLENSTLIKPGKDSTKVRFFFNASDNIRLPNNRVADSVDLQLYTTEKIIDGEYKAPEKYIRIKGIRVNSLGKYLSIYTGAENIRYGFELCDAKNPNTILQDYEWNSEDGFIKGVFDYYGDGIFRTVRLRKSTREGEYSFNLATGTNAEYIFGLN